MRGRTCYLLTVLATSAPMMSFIAAEPEPSIRVYDTQAGTICSDLEDQVGVDLESNSLNGLESGLKSIFLVVGSVLGKDPWSDGRIGR
jgi:hypothetical protein